MLRRTARRDRLIGLFILGAVLFNPPILNLFGDTRTTYGHAEYNSGPLTGLTG